MTTKLQPSIVAVIAQETLLEHIGRCKPCRESCRCERGELLGRIAAAKKRAAGMPEHRVIPSRPISQFKCLCTLREREDLSHLFREWERRDWFETGDLDLDDPAFRSFCTPEELETLNGVYERSKGAS